MGVWEYGSMGVWEYGNNTANGQQSSVNVFCYSLANWRN
jgi:hypothetical protein